MTRDPLEPTNEQRALWANSAIVAYNAAKKEVIDEDTAKDLITEKFKKPFIHRAHA